MFSNECPYCGGRSFIQIELSETDRKRPGNQKLLQCADEECQGFAIRKQTGKVYPLSEKDDRNSDPILRARK